MLKPGETMPLTIAMVISRFSPYVGGTERQCQQLSKVLARHGHRITILTETTFSGLPLEQVTQGMRVVRFQKVGAFLLAPVMFMIRAVGYIKKHREIDVIHAHMVSATALIAVIAARWFGKTALIKIAGARRTGDWGTSSQSIQGRIKLQIVKRSGVPLVCPDEETAIEALQMAASAQLIHVIPNGVDDQVFVPASAEKKAWHRQALELPEKTRLAVYSGRWSPGKGVDVLLNIWSGFSQGPNTSWGLCLLLSNTADLPPSLRQQLSELRTHVRWVAQPPDVLPYYQACDIALLLSEGEGLSNFLLEAMACGLPTLTSAAAAISKKTDQAEWGWVIPNGPHLAQDTAFKLQELQGDVTSMQEKGKRARQKIESDFSIEKTAAAYERLYDTLRVK